MRGYQKRVIFLKHTGSRLFDEAYFVVSPMSEGAAEGDMVLEANRIIEDNIKKDDSDKGVGRLKGFYWFLLGAAVSAIVCSTVLFLVFNL
ncbi:MAG: hypothetical protein J6B48_08300 [Clostridia bacterium]|nr:hypothetical protein [Clostridia bacterium]